MEVGETGLMGKFGGGGGVCYSASKLLLFWAKMVKNRDSEKEKNLYIQLPYKLISQYYLVASL